MLHPVSKYSTVGVCNVIDVASVAQLAEQWFCKPQVIGSSPITSLFYFRKIIMERQLMLITGDELKRFYSKFHQGPEDSCWPWSGKLDKGYGRILIGGRSLLAHQVAYWLKTKQKPSLYVVHTCDNKSCVNPKHLKEDKNKGGPKVSKSKTNPI